MSGRQINRGKWSKERIAAFKRFLGGDKSVSFRTKKSDGTFYKKPITVASLMKYYSDLSFSVKGGKLMVNSGDNTLEVLTDEQVTKKAQGYYRDKNGLGKAPSIYNFMKTKFANVSYKKVEKAIKALPQYQKYEARHVMKPKVRKVMVSQGPGLAIDADTMYFESGYDAYYDHRINGGYDALTVVVDRFSGFIGIAPLKRGPGGKTAAKCIRNIKTIFRGGFPNREGQIFTDYGSEFKGTFKDDMQDLGYEHVVVSKVAGAPSAHAERAVGIIRKLVNQKLTSNNQRPAKKAQRWWPMVNQIVDGYNDTPLTDARAPYTPNQLKRASRAIINKVRNKMIGAGRKRVEKTGRIVNGARVSKVLKVLKVGDTVRIALENLRKTGANKRSKPKQRWSSDTYNIQRVVSRKLGMASYVLQGLPRRRFEREDLQLISDT